MGAAKLKTSNATLTEMEVSGTPYYAAPKHLKEKWESHQIYGVLV